MVLLTKNKGVRVEADFSIDYRVYLLVVVVMVF